MKTLSDIYDELSCISDQLVLLSIVVSDEYAEGAARPAASVIQAAIYAASQHINHVTDNIDEISRRTV